MTNRLGQSVRGAAVMAEMIVAAKTGHNFDRVLTEAMRTQEGGHYSGSVDPLKPDGTPFPGSPFTGGGLPGNLPRVLPEGLGAELTPNWDVPEIFRLIEQRGRIQQDEMVRVFNMGVGFVFVVAPEDVKRAAETSSAAFEMGRIVQGEGVRLN